MQLVSENGEIGSLFDTEIRHLESLAARANKGLHAVEASMLKAPRPTGDAKIELKRQHLSQEVKIEKIWDRSEPPMLSMLPLLTTVFRDPTGLPSSRKEIKTSLMNSCCSACRESGRVEFTQG